MKALPYIPDYIIESVLGEGGMATVYLGIQQKLQRKVAIKILDPALLKNKILADRFVIEAQTAANLNHPNIISIYDVGQVGIYYYIVMELLDGSLKDLIRSSRNRKLPPAEALNIISKITPALDYAHKQGIIHRDIKPDNIMFRQDGTPVLVDFGIARAVDTDLQMTKTGMGIGTPHYMSPEQCQTGPLDGRSDFYSLGIVFYELITGEKPYRADTILAVALKHIQEPVPKLPEHLIRYQLLLDKMMAKNKEDRVQNGTELQRLIDEALREPQTSSFQTAFIPQPTAENGANVSQHIAPNVSSNISSNISSNSSIDLGIKPGTGMHKTVDPGIKPGTGMHKTVDPGIKPETGTHKPIDLGIKPGEIKPGKEENLEESIIILDKELEAQEEIIPIETPKLAAKPQYEDPPVPDWFRESLERTIPTESSSEPAIRKPYKEEPKSKLSSRIFLIVLLAVLLLLTFAYFFYQGMTDKEINQGADSSPRKSVGTKSNIPGKTSNSPTEKEKQQNNASSGPGTITNVSKKTGAPLANSVEKKPGGEKAVPPAAISDDDAFKNATAQNTAEAYRKYLADYPSGNHVNEATTRIAQLKEGISPQDLNRIKSKSFYSLRNVYHTLNISDVASIIKRYGFYDRNYNKSADFKNEFEKKDINGVPVIIDYKTDLMWHPGGSDKQVEQKKIPRWLKDLNGKQYAGYLDWRLPTFEEAASLLKANKNKKGLYIDPLFSPVQKHIWTGDQFEANNLWVVHFYEGIVLGSEGTAIHFIRPVRSIK